MAKTIVLELRPDDAEPILRQAAYNAAKYSAWGDYLTRRTWRAPVQVTPEAKKLWADHFLAAKRMVEAFGVEYEPTSEDETLTVDYPYVGGKRVRLGNTGFHQIVGSKPDYKNPVPSYRGLIHHESCNHAAERVVRAWRATLTTDSGSYRIAV